MLTQNLVYRSVELEAFEAMNAGDHCRVIALLHNVDAPGCAMMRARVLVRIHEFDRVLRECNQRTYTQHDPHESVQLLEMEAAVHFALGEVERAWDIIARQKVAAKKSKERILVAYALQSESWLACQTKDVDRALFALVATRAEAEKVCDRVPRKYYHVDRVGLSCRVAHIEGWTHSLRGDFASQEACFLSAATSAAAHLDRRMEAQILTNLVRFMVETRSLSLFKYAVKRFQTFPWSAHTDEYKSIVATALRDAECIYGFKNLCNVKARTAPTLSTRFSMAERSLQYDCWNEKRAFIEDSRFCVSMLLDMNSIEAAGVEIGSVRDFAAILAPLDRALAHRVREIFRERIRNVPNFYGPTHRPLFEARIRFVDACIAKADDDLSQALAHYNEAFDLISDATNSPLAAIAGLERYSITRNPSDLEFARKFIVDNPRARFSRRLSAALTTTETLQPNGFPYLGLYAPHGPNPAPSRYDKPLSVISG